MSGLRILCLQHAPVEGPGCLGDWARTHGHAFQTALLYGGEPLPAPSSFDWLVVLGGPMGVHDTRQYPWLSLEKHLIGEAIQSGRTVLGICLGGQLIADVLGAKVSRARHREMGWFPITTTPEARGRFPLLPPSIQAVCWHNDTFDIPAGCVAFGSSRGCPNQGFIYRDTVLALQFHLEWPHQDLRRIVQDSPEDFEPPGSFVQRPEQLLEHVEWSQRANELMFSILDALPE
jgi:GMP synthase-like glutamine amidotransferase